MSPIADQGATTRERWLLGASQLDGFVRFVQERMAGDGAQNEASLMAEWRAAAKVYEQLATSQVGLADGMEYRELSPRLVALAEKLTESASFQAVFDTVPIAFAMVEIDRLIAAQCDVDLTRVDRLRQMFEQDCSEDRLFDVCMGIEQAPPSVRLIRKRDRRFEFAGTSHDFRVVGTKVLSPSLLPAATFAGSPAAVVAVAVGHSANCLNAVRFGTRCILNNGYHRVYALRELGVTHVPCVVQVVTHDEEFAHSAMSEVQENRQLYINAPRPPLMCDFFDDRLSRSFTARQTARHLRISIEVDTVDLLS